MSKATPKKLKNVLALRQILQFSLNFNKCIFVSSAWFAYVYGCAVCPGLVPTEGKRGLSDSLELELQKVVSQPVGDGSHTRAL